MVKRILSNGMVQTFVRLITALSFALFTSLLTIFTFSLLGEIIESIIHSSPLY